MQSAPSRPEYLDGQPDVYTSNGLGGASSSYFPQQRVSPLTFAGGLGIPMSIGGARARAPYASSGLYNAATTAAVGRLWPAISHVLRCSMCALPVVRQQDSHLQACACVASRESGVLFRQYRS